MHPWMVEQLAHEHRRDLLAEADRRRLLRRWRARPVLVAAFSLLGAQRGVGRRVRTVGRVAEISWRARLRRL